MVPSVPADELAMGGGPLLKSGSATTRLDLTPPQEGSHLGRSPAKALGELSLTQLFRSHS
jgi:hypothetical protein